MGNCERGEVRLRVLERSSRYLNVGQLMVKYRARVLSYVEYRTAAVYHATDTVLEPLDRIQSGFVTRLGLSEVAALVEFRLAPLSCRRDKAMLGVLHRTALKKGPSHLERFFYHAEGATRTGTRLSENRHHWQLFFLRE